MYGPMPCPVTSASLALLSLTLRGRDLHCFKMCLQPMTRLSQSLQCDRRITANKVALIIQLQTRFIYYNLFTIKAPCYLVI